MSDRTGKPALKTSDTPLRFHNDYFHVDLLYKGFRISMTLASLFTIFSG
jgi:hypothetical protein